MEIKEIIESKKRLYELEKEMILDFSNSVKSQFDLKQVKDTLDSNGFSGVYVLSDSEYLDFTQKDNSAGRYNTEEKVIVLPESSCNNKNTRIHEIGHAFLGSRNTSSIVFDERPLFYGLGLEEGAVTLLANTSNIEDISQINYQTYPKQSLLFQQLNELYKNSDLRKYSNILIHLFKEPKDFNNLIREIYDNIFKSEYGEFDSYMSMKSAFSLIQGTDLLTIRSELCGDMFNNLKLLNLLYFYIADKDIRRGKTNNEVFVPFEPFNFTSEEKLLSLLFGTDPMYILKMVQKLDILLDMFQDEFELIGRVEEDERKLIHLPR